MKIEDLTLKQIKEKCEEAKKKSSDGSCYECPFTLKVVCHRFIDTLTSKDLKREVEE